MKPLLPWKSNSYFLLVRLCVRACGYPGAWAYICAYGHVALLIQHATRMRHIVTSFVAPQSPPYFSTVSHKRCDYRKKVTEHKMCAFIFFYKFCLKHFSFQEAFSEISSKMSKSLHVKYQSFLLDFKETWIFSTDFRKTHITSFIKIRPAESRVVACGRADGQTEGHDEANSHFSQLCERAWN